LKQRKGKAKFLHNFGSRKQQKKTGGSTGDRSNTRSTGTNHSQNHKKKEERRRKTCSRPGKQSVLLAIFCLICICTVQVNFNSLAQCRNTRGLARVLLCPARASDRAGQAGSSPKKIESVEIKILHVLEKKCIFINLFNDIRMKNKKNTDFFLVTNF
jgi:hypothetical protein